MSPSTPGAVQDTSWLASAGLRLSDWFERWFPDAYALAIVAVGIVAVASMSIGNSPAQTAQWFGAGFWDLVAFTMQVSMLIISGFALAQAPPVHAPVVCAARTIAPSAQPPIWAWEACGPSA
jgi:short-chain fatty acids transporter